MKAESLFSNDSPLRSFLNERVSAPPKYLFICFSTDGKAEAIKKRLKDCLFVDWDKLSAVDGEIIVSGKFPLSTFSFIFIGAVGEHADMATCVMNFISTNKMPFISYGSTPESCNKILQSVLLKQNKLPQIKTVIAHAEEVTAASLVKQLKLPVVSKIIHGSQGKGIEKHDTKEHLEKFLSRHKGETFIFQEFIPNDGDFRVFFVKNKMLYAIKRKSAKKTEFRNNVSLGGTKEHVTLDAKGEKLAVEACKTMGFDMTGVDLIQNKDTGEYFIMEINAAPQFSGDNFEKVIDEIIRLIK